MIISRTPVRVSFFDGGSDLPSYYWRYGGAVLSTAIDSSIYITVSRKFDDALKVSYSRTEEEDHASKVEHPLVPGTFALLGIDGGLEITSVADIPAKVTGLGSSSSFKVGLLNALYAYQGCRASAARLAEESCDIEISRCGEPIGKQDQYAAAFGVSTSFVFIPMNPWKLRTDLPARSNCGPAIAITFLLHRNHSLCCSFVTEASRRNKNGADKERWNGENGGPCRLFL